MPATKRIVCEPGFMLSWAVPCVENARLYEREESLYQRVWRFQAQHAAQLLPWERTWLSQALEELTYYLIKLAQAPDARRPWTQPPSTADTAQVLMQLAQYTLWVVQQTVRHAQHTIQAAAQTTQTMQATLQAIHDARSHAPAGHRDGLWRGQPRRGFPLGLADHPRGDVPQWHGASAAAPTRSPRACLGVTREAVR
jgi:hypothetical protein